MMQILTAAEMRDIESAAIESGAVTGLELMERAGAGVVAAVFETWPEMALTSHRAVVLCGPGNNGGDGFVIARLLRNRGWQVEVFLLGDPGRLPPDARTNHDRWRALGAVRSFPEARPDPSEADLIVDAGFGTGLARPLADDLIAAFLSCMPERDLKAPDDAPFVVAVDIPTGLSSDSGALMPAAVGADLTVTFHRAKLGHYLGRGPEFSGRLAIVPIGLDLCDATVPGVAVAGAAPGLWPLAKAGGHKYSHGHALILSGGPGRGGAARLAARGALRVGAGLVTLACPAEALAENAARLDAIMLRPIAETDDLVACLSDDRIAAVCLGPGLGTGDAARVQVTAVLGAERATVLDADALSAHADDPASLFDQLHDRCVLTPHGGEFARLFPDLAERLSAPAKSGPAFSKVDAARAAAARAGCTVLFKGPDTVIAAPDGRCSVNAALYERAAPWLATAGAGDVLAGMIAGLLARGFDPLSAAEAAAWLHVEAARSFGPGLIAEDLPDALPRVFRALAL